MSRVLKQNRIALPWEAIQYRLDGLHLPAFSLHHLACEALEVLLAFFLALSAGEENVCGSRAAVGTGKAAPTGGEVISCIVLSRDDGVAVGDNTIPTVASPDKSTSFAAPDAGVLRIGMLSSARYFPFINCLASRSSAVGL